MNKKTILATLFMTSAIWCVHDIQSYEMRIKELEEARFQKETEIAELNRKILEESETYFTCKRLGLDFWVASKGQNSEESKQSFVCFINKLADMVAIGKDIKPIIDESQNIIKDEDDMVILFAISRVVFQECFVRNLAIKYNNLIDELLVINNELHNLKKSNA